MIDVYDQGARSRLQKSMDHWHREMEVYRKARRETVMLHAGSPEWAARQGVQADKKVWGNLIQLSAISHKITLAYNDPRFTVIANLPDGDAIAPRLQNFLNRYSQLLGLGDIARAAALDSFFGYGIVWVGEGILPPGVQAVVKQQVGPMCKRVSQDNFLFDGAATCWEEVSYQAHYVYAPLDEAKSFEPFLAQNPEGTAALQEYGRNQNQTDSRAHQDPIRQHTAQAITRLIEVYLPDTQQIATWPANDINFAGVQGEPLMVVPYNGHHTGPYSVLSHLDVPDNLIPAARCESVKNLHYLFNELMETTSNQATEAKVNSVYETGSQRDAERLEEAEDRDFVGVSNIQKIGLWEKPGPTQSQTSHMLASLSMFKEFSGNLDDTLGLGPTASTATQSQLIRQATSAGAADARRGMDRLMENVARKLSHLALGDKTLTLPMRRRFGQSEFDVNSYWLPPEQMPRTQTVDDFAVTIIPRSMEYIAPAARLQQINAAITAIFQAMQLVAQGAPLNLEKFIEIQADYNDLPELKDLFVGALPDHAQAKQAAASIRDPNRGQYTRTNVSERTNAGALAQALTQSPQDGAAGGVTIGG